MAVTIKSAHEIELMRESCRLLSLVFDGMEKMIKPGITTAEINQLGDQLIREYGGIPNFLNYDGYPASICVSVNDEVVHGIPSDKRVLQEGDIVSLDAGLIYEGYHSDAARTYPVGNISKEAADLIEVTRQSFFEGIKYARAGNRLNDISAAVQQYAESHGCGVVRDYVGHGIGTKMHEDPEVPNYVPDRRERRPNPRLLPGMTLAVEPMINAGGPAVRVLSNKWTVVTVDGSLSAHYENTILITDGEPEILTLAEDI